MSLTTSYVVSLQTGKTAGTTIGDKSVDSTSSLKQAINNIFTSGTVFKFDIELSSNESRTIDFTGLGVDRLRIILLKSDYQFGYTISQSGLTTATPWVLSRTTFIDYSIFPPPGFVDPNYLTPNLLRITSPTSTHPVATVVDPIPVIVVQVIAVANTST